MDQLFEATFSPIASSGKPFSKCGKCRRYMHYIDLRPPRLHCRTCNETYALPALGTIKLYKELVCPVDGFELVLFSTGSKGKGFPICPHCYIYPPFDNVPSEMGCNKCPHVECMHSMTQNAITKCPTESCSGSLILDATSAPRWKMGCNICTLVSCFNDCVNGIYTFNLKCRYQTQERNM
jgi:DNA topoisomerase-3